MSFEVNFLIGLICSGFHLLKHILSMLRSLYIDNPFKVVRLCACKSLYSKSSIYWCHSLRFSSSMFFKKAAPNIFFIVEETKATVTSI